MKCPKCGSDNITTERRINGYHVCKRCSYQWQIGSNPEPTTAEQKLWWLIENFEVVSVFHCDHGKLGIRLDLTHGGKKFFLTDSEIITTRDKLITEAYKWAKGKNNEMY